MSWRDTFREGSFRGAAFKIDESQGSFGRRNKVHEYPQRDTPWSEDLGRAARRWSVECFVVGDDYDKQRDALIKALEAKGGGTLVHPYLGTMTASVETPGQVTESTSQGGLARFSIQFVETGMDGTPAATTDTQAASVAASAATKAVAATSMASRLKVANQPGFVLAAAGDVLGKAQAAIGAALAAVSPAADLVFSVDAQLHALAAGAVAVLSLPISLVETVYAAIGGIETLATYGDDALTQLVGPVGATGSAGLMAFGDDLPVVATPTPARAAQAANQIAIAQLVRVAAAASAVNVVADTDFVSYDDAVGLRDPLADQLDQLATDIADAGDDALAAAVDDLRLAMIRDVTARGASLARLYAYRPLTTEPALVIAQRLYGDATRADEIVARNGVQAPLFVPGGVALEVLSDA